MISANRFCGVQLGTIFISDGSLNCGIIFFKHHKKYLLDLLMCIYHICLIVKNVINQNSYYYLHKKKLYIIYRHTLRNDAYIKYGELNKTHFRYKPATVY